MKSSLRLVRMMRSLMRSPSHARVGSSSADQPRGRAACHWRGRAVRAMVSRMGMRGLFAIGCAVALFALAAPAAAECIAPPDYVRPVSETAEDAVIGPTRTDSIGRVVAPVTVNGQGPFRFIVDTGANRSVLSQALAQRLGLSANGVGDVHSVHGVTPAPLVPVRSLSYGQLSLGSAEMPMLRGAVLAGEQGCSASMACVDGGYASTSTTSASRSFLRRTLRGFGVAGRL